MKSDTYCTYQAWYQFPFLNVFQAIELELQKIEAQQAKKHVQLLSAFLPEAFLRRGGE
jgi:Dynein associated protein